MEGQKALMFHQKHLCFEEEQNSSVFETDRILIFRCFKKNL